MGAYGLPVFDCVSSRLAIILREYDFRIPFLAMRIATHQLIFLPWPGLFVKAMQVDCLVLLDEVQFPRGRSWVNRNRLKNEQGELWLTAPVHRKGRGLQEICEVELFHASNWKRKHLRGIRQSYADAPYRDEFLPQLREIYKADHQRLASLNLALIDFLLRALDLTSPVLLQSELAVKGHGTDLIVRICQKLEADSYCAFPIALKYLDEGKLQEAGIDVVPRPYRTPVYPQLWGPFLGNLSTLDLLLNCGPKSKSLLGATTVG